MNIQHYNQQKTRATNTFIHTTKSCWRRSCSRFPSGWNPIHHTWAMPTFRDPSAGASHSSSSIKSCLPRSATAPIILWQTLWLSCSELLSLWSNLDNLSSCLSSGLHVLIGCQYRWQLFLPDVIPSTIVLLAWPFLLPRKKNKSFQPQSLVSLLLLFSYLRWISLLLPSLLCFW